MPELPDVEVFRRQVDPHALGRSVHSLEVPVSALLADDLDAPRLGRALAGQRFRETRRHGKHLFLQVDDGPWLALHFGMSAHPQVQSADDPQPDHVGMAITFEDRGRLFYITQRKLGEIALVDSPEAYIRDHGLGPDVLGLGKEAFRQLAERDMQVKCWLMDQSTMAGLGNIYSDEALFHAGLDPRTAASSLRRKHIDRLYAAIRAICEEAIAVEADPDSMPADFLLPHRHDDGHCPCCGARLEQLRVCGRTGYRCPRCQPTHD